MANFCGKCGTKPDEVTGLCPSCNAQNITAPPTAQTPTAPASRSFVQSKTNNPKRERRVNSEKRIKQYYRL